MKKFSKLWEKLIKFCCTTMLNCRPKIIVYESCIKYLGSCMYRYTRYTIHDTRYTIHDTRFTIHDSRNTTFSCIVFRTLVYTFTYTINSKKYTIHTCTRSRWIFQFNWTKQAISISFHIINIFNIFKCTIYT